MKKGTFERTKQVIRRAHIILEIIDARDPYGTRCEQMEELIHKWGKKLIIIINKADLVDKIDVAELKKDLSREHYTIFTSTKNRYGKRRIIYAIKKFAHPEKENKVAVIGYPNVGKSSVINMLCGRGKASTSPVPGHTKGEQWVRLAPFIMLSDTPGILPRGDSSRDLILKGAFDVDKIRDPVVPAWELISHYKENYPHLIEYYKADPKDKVDKILTDMTINHKKMLKGGEPNLDEMAKKLVREWQRGKVIKILAQLKKKD